MVARRPCLCFPTVSMVQAMWPTRAYLPPTQDPIKAHSTHPLHPRPYGSLGLLPISVASPYLRLMSIGRPVRDKLHNHSVAHCNNAVGAFSNFQVMCNDHKCLTIFTIEAEAQI